MLIPLVDLTAQQRQIAHELQQVFARLFELSWNHCRTAGILASEVEQSLSKVG
jgi:hypothetical protein